MKDIVLYRPYTPEEEVTVKFYNDDSELVLTKTVVMANKFRAIIDIVASGAVAREAWSPNIEEVVVFYKA